MTNAVNVAALGSTGVSPGFKNRIINGAMQVAQRGVGPTVGSNYTTVDRWKFYQNGSGAYSSAQVVDAPAGFTHSLKLTVTTAQASLGSTDYFAVPQIIEGVNVPDLNWGTTNAQPATVSFWVKSSLTGTFSAGVQSCDGAFAVYMTTFSISSANTWTKVSFTIPGPTIGSWSAGTTSASIFLFIGLGNGSTYSTASTNSWVTGNYFGYSGQTNFISTNGATFYITGVQLEVGATATNFDYRPYSTELALCQRYYQKFQGTGSDDNWASGLAYNANLGICPFVWSPPLRAAATVTSSGSFEAVGSSVISAATLGFSDTTTFSAQIGVTTTSLTPGGGCLVRTGSGTSFISVSAEL